MKIGFGDGTFITFFLFLFFVPTLLYYTLIIFLLSISSFLVFKKSFRSLLFFFPSSSLNLHLFFLLCLWLVVGTHIRIHTLLLLSPSFSNPTTSEK